MFSILTKYHSVFYSFDSFPPITSHFYTALQTNIYLSKHFWLPFFPPGNYMMYSLKILFPFQCFQLGIHHTVLFVLLFISALIFCFDGLFNLLYLLHLCFLYFCILYESLFKICICNIYKYNEIKVHSSSESNYIRLMNFQHWWNLNYAPIYFINKYITNYHSKNITFIYSNKSQWIKVQQTYLEDLMNTYYFPDFV